MDGIVPVTDWKMDRQKVSITRRIIMARRKTQTTAKAAAAVVKEAAKAETVKTAAAPAEEAAVKEAPAAEAPVENELTFGDDNTSTATLEQITAQCKDLLIYTNGNAIEIVEVPDPPPEQPPHYYYHPTTDTKADETKGSPKTFDAGVGIYAVTAVLSVTGVAWTAKKRH